MTFESPGLRSRIRLLAIRGLGALAALSLAGCDVNAPAAFEPPPLHVVETRPANGEGTDCAREDPNCGVPVRDALVVRFDRPLWPEPAVFEAARIYTGDPRNRFRLSELRYDLVDRTLTYRLASRLGYRALFRVDLPGVAEGEVPRAYDGGALEAGPVPLSFSFFTQAATATPTPAPASGAEPTCDDVVSMFSGRCASAACHGGATPALGLALDSRDALRATLLDRVARQTETGHGAGVAERHPPRFGTAMPLVDPGNSAMSYLLYKVLIAPGALAPCAGGDCAAFTWLPGAEACEPYSDEERERLRNWFVRGEPMPPPLGVSAGSEAPLDCASVRALVRWIDAGARCD